MNTLHDAAVANCPEQLHEAADTGVDWRDLLARGSRAKHIVELGASFGVSTLFLAAAARDNGGALLTTEAHPARCAAVRTSKDLVSHSLGKMELSCYTPGST
jgi:predicted O-methyltransferase YrrM